MRKKRKQYSAGFKAEVALAVPCKNSELLTEQWLHQFTSCDLAYDWPVGVSYHDRQ